MTTEALNQLLRASDYVANVTQRLAAAHCAANYVEGIAIRPALKAARELHAQIGDLISAAKCDQDQILAISALKCDQDQMPASGGTCMNCGGATPGSSVNVCSNCVTRHTKNRSK